MADTSAAGIMPRVLPKPRGAPGSAVSTPSAPHSSGFSLRRRNLGRHALLRGCRLAERAPVPPRRQRLACRPPSKPHEGSRRCTGVVSPDVDSCQRVSSQALRVRACHSACSASAAVAAPGCSSKPASSPPFPAACKPLPPQPPRACAPAAGARGDDSSAAAAVTPAASDPAQPASSAPCTRRAIRSTRRAALSATALPPPPRFPPLPPPRLQLRALRQPPQSRRRLLRGTAAPHQDAQPHAPPIHPPRPPRQSQAGTARQRAQPPAQPPALRPSSAQLPGARAARGSPVRGIPALYHLPTATAALRSASLRRSHENLLQRRGRAPAAPRRPSAPPLPSHRSCTSAASVAPAALHAERELHACSQPS
jgi:hypothetical protein